MHLVKANTKHQNKIDSVDTIKFVDELIASSGCENTSRAYANDLRVFWSWAKIKHGVSPHYPCRQDLILSFILKHSARPEPLIDQQLVELGIRAKTGPYKISSLRRIINTLSREHTIRNITNSASSPKIRLLLRNLAKKYPHLKKVQKKAITVDILHAMRATCSNSLTDKRDKALLSTMFAAGGRRRSEIVSLQFSDVVQTMKGYELTFRKTKTTDSLTIPIQGKAAKDLHEWLEASDIQDGAVFRSIIGKYKVSEKPLQDRWVHRIIQNRLSKAGFDPKGFSAHSIRAGFVTSCAKAGITLAETMKMSAHKTHAIALDYYRPGDLVISPTALIME